MNLNKYVPLALLALTLSGGSAFAQVKKKPVPSPKNKPGTQAIAAKSDILPVDKDVIIGKLPNGLTYYIRANVEPKSRAELYLVNKAGSVLENDDQQGLAHFTEHMAFNGTRDFPKNQMVDYLQKAGVKFGADLNAYTSFNETVYQLPLPTDTVSVFEKGFNILANWAGYVSFDPVEIDKERGVVLEEERLRGKNAQERLQQQTLPVLLNNSRYALRLPIGKEDILKNFKPETIKAFYQDWYRPDLQAVVAVGDFDPKRVEALIKQNFSQLKNPAAEKPRTKYSVPATPGTAVKIVTDPEYPYTVAQIIVKHPGTVTKTTGDYMQQVRIQLFNQMLNSRINELLQKPNPPFLYGRTSYGNFIGDQDAYTSLVVAKPGELEKAVKAVVAESERARKFGFTLTELERAKQDALVGIGNAYRERDKTPSANFVREYQANFLTGEAIPGISYEYNFYIGNIYKVSLADMNAMAGKFISDQNRVVVVQAPDKEKANLPDEKTLLNWIATGGQNVTAYIDNVSSDPLLAKVPEGTKVAKEETDEALGTTTLTLGNGLKVILKPTEYRNDQILINGYAFGGTSLASDDEFTSANLASSIISGSGIAQFNQGMLDKKLAGKNLSISPYISEFAQGISGNTSPADFETALQLIYLYFTQPRKDKDIWDANIDQTRSVLSTRGLDPGSVYQDTVSAVLSNYNFRGMVTTLPRLNAATLDKAYDFYKKRFADASGFTFTLVGNFNVETIKPYLEHYLGGLPSTNSKETYKNMNIEPPAGLITKTVNKGVGEKSTVQLVFSGDYDYNEANNIQVDALEEVLNIKLIERLREQESGVYAPGVRAGYHKIPGGRYTFTISFGCAPENVDKLINATMEEIAKIKQNGALPADIQKFVAEEARSTQQQLKQNVFWAGYLASTSQNGENPDQILGHVSSLEQITPQSTKDAANKYLSGKNLIKLILMPEKK
ncbi:insulinase family protein [Mucilaginibacter gossypii]|uniref:M16 family metallopeptidase n=1 Tax=Mucilaginibacter gossypii TaxID=551996 RepID=UPI000DCCBD2E|nr:MULTISPECIES: M16 family metallopeptidase [Mucilaginibacter]QTE36093.1 insulinase family protein [Mucilaginibacter gossypii]RAV59994.1 insulinase family protein [Mucilaginibacter rubeus]